MRSRDCLFDPDDVPVWSPQSPTRANRRDVAEQVQLFVGLSVTRRMPPVKHNLHLRTSPESDQAAHG